MSVIIKTSEMQYKDNNGVYHGVNAIAEKKIADQVADLDAAIDAQETRIATDISNMQSDVAGIEAQRQTMIAAIASVAGQGTDTTLTQQGVAADAKTVGDEVSDLKSAIAEPNGVGVILLPQIYSMNNQILFTKNDVHAGTMIYYKLTVSPSSAWISFKNASDVEITNAWIGKKSSDSSTTVKEGTFVIPEEFDHASLRTSSGNIEISYFLANWMPSIFYNYALKSIGNALPSGVTTLGDLPINSVIYLTGTTLDALSDKPMSSSNGAIIITFNGVPNTSTGKVQQVIYWGSGLRFVRSYTNGLYSDWARYAMYNELQSPLVLHPNGLIGNVTTYNDLNTLPLNTIMTFYSSAIDNILHKPDSITGLFTVLTFGCEESSYNGAVQVILSMSTQTIIMYRTYVSGSWKEWKANVTTSKTITVRSDDSGDYTSVVDAVVYTMNNPTTENEPYIIDIGEGTFDLSSVATLVVNEQIDRRGLFIMPYTTIVGKGRNETKLVFNYDGNNDDVMSQVSAFNIVYEGALKDLSIECKNIRYVFHADYPLTGEAENDSNEKLNNNTFIMQNVEAIHNGFDDGLTPSYKVPDAWGQGLRTGLIRKFINCKFVSKQGKAWLCHDRRTATKASQLFFDGCEFISYLNNVASLRFVSWGSNLHHIVNIKNCAIRTFISLGVSTAYDANAKIDYYIEAADTDSIIIEEKTNNSHKNRNYFNFGTMMCINNTGSSVVKGQPVKVNGYNIAKTNTENGIQGIALNDASSDEIVNVKIAGSIELATSFSAGTRIDYSNGAWVEDVNGFLIVMNSEYCRFVT